MLSNSADPPGFAGSTTKASRGRAVIVTAMLFVFMLINFADKAVLGLAAIPLMADLGITPGQYGLVASSFFLLFSVAALLVGFLSNHFKTKWIIFAMAVVWSVSQLPMLLPAAGFLTLLLTRVVLGAGEGPAYPVANHAAHKWFLDRERTMVTGILSVGISIGVIVAAPALGWLIAEHGWRAAFGVLGAVGLVWAILWLWLGGEGPFGDRTAEHIDTTAAAGSAVPTWRILATGTWIASVVGAFAAYWSISLLIAWVPPYLTTVLGLAPRDVGWLIVLPWAVNIVAVLGQAVLTRRLMRRGVSTRWARGLIGGIFVILAGLATLGLTMAGANWLKIILLMLGFGLAPVIIAIGQTTSGEIAPVNRRGGVLGTYAAVYSVAGIVAPGLTGSLLGSAVSPAAGFGTVFMITGLLLTGAGVLVAVLVRPARDRAQLDALAGTVPAPTPSPPDTTAPASGNRRRAEPADGDHSTDSRSTA